MVARPGVQLSNTPILVFVNDHAPDEFVVVVVPVPEQYTRIPASGGSILPLNVPFHAYALLLVKTNTRASKISLILFLNIFVSLLH